MAGETIDYGARPWAIAVAIGPDTALADCIRRYFPVVEFVTREAATELHQSEFDAVILVGDAPKGLDASLQVLQFGGTPAADGAIGDGFLGSSHAVFWNVTGVGARSFTLEDVAGQLGVHGITRSTVVPDPGSDYSVLKWMSPARFVLSDPEGRSVTAFATDATGAALAGYVKRSSSSPAGYLWWLPTSALLEDDRWLTAAVRWWQQIDAARFPPSAMWTEDSNWMTHGELVAADVIRKLDEEAEEFRSSHEARLADAARAREAAQATAASGVRRLLLAQGDELVEAVIETLNLLGFIVLNSDQLSENASAKQEDLRIIDGDWICLVEVKGYKKGAKASDLMQIGKAVEVYMERGNPRPAARWYVVNHNFQIPPGLRDAPLAGAPEIPVFASMGGAVLDTRVLYALHRSVEAGDLSAEDARGKLKQASGVYPVNM